ncbi:MAG TPA: glycosyltransferase family 2 protein [Candidatus Atopostipes pullistercoris]|uniref:Glycosyltransferase family 2 protein n=1 Tax=Candidatus Atopostipes pullistercoris TaxID=2838467 RepID=A0A9D2JYD0_9LACT|nr:glycosyltransferase family 2 protein [Candidatus Atopostipes pullistercoris]
MKKITILIPTYNEEEVLPALMDALKQVTQSLEQYHFEFLFVDDGSTDETTTLLQQFHAENSHVQYVELSRNFGKEIAMLAGFDYADGDAVIIMDADLQHPPDMIPELIHWWEEGYEDVYTVRKEKAEKNPFKRWASNAYYTILQSLTSYDVHQGAGDFRLLDRNCIEALKRIRENERNTKGMYAYIGFRKKALEYEEAERVAGETKWKFGELLKLAIDGITSYSTVPLRVWSVVGLIISFFSFIFLFIELFKAIVYGSDVAGYPTLIAAIVFLGGIQLISLGAIGEYLARVFIETKNRPAYFVREASMEESERLKGRDQENEE